MPSRRLDFVVTCVCLALLGYFAWHAWRGPRGYPFRDSLAAEAETFADKLAAIEGRRGVLENKVALMRPESIDPDLLDELVRSRLGMAASNDLVVMEPNEIPQENP